VVFGVAFQVVGQLPDSARQQRDLYISAAGVLSVQLELLDIQRFRVLSHFESAYCRRRIRLRKAAIAFSEAQTRFEPRCRS
jgi:hypothetical protein